MALDVQSGEVQKPKKTLAYYLDLMKPERFAVGHAILPIDEARLGEAKNKLLYHYTTIFIQLLIKICYL